MLGELGGLVWEGKSKAVAACRHGVLFAGGLAVEGGGLEAW